MPITDDQMARINFLARKSKAEGLTDEEKTEQHTLRMAYVAAVKASLTPLLDSIRVVHVDETVEVTSEGRTVRETIDVTEVAEEGTGVLAINERVVIEEEGEQPA